MPLFDMPLEQLQTYLPPRQEPADFDSFWQRTLEESRQYPLGVRLERVDYGLRTVETFDLSYSGYGGQTVKGWLLLPKDRAEPLPCVVEYIGYGGGRGYPLDWLVWASAGYAHLVMDTRGQGSTWQRGDTPDDAPTNPHHPGFMTKGIESPENYYYRRVFTDAVRAVDVARGLEETDPQLTIVTGGSQGGGISLAVAGLTDVAYCLPDVPFLCHYRRATNITGDMPYGEISRYLSIHRGSIEGVFQTLSYFDGVNFAARAKASALFSVALMDTICPPSTVFAAYNHYTGDKDIRVWHYNNHEGGRSDQTVEKLRWLEAKLG